MGNSFVLFKYLQVLQHSVSAPPCASLISPFARCRTSSPSAWVTVVCSLSSWPPPLLVSPVTWSLAASFPLVRAPLCSLAPRTLDRPAPPPASSSSPPGVTTEPPSPIMGPVCRQTAAWSPRPMVSSQPSSPGTRAPSRPTRGVSSLLLWPAATEARVSLAPAWSSSQAPQGPRYRPPCQDTCTSSPRGWLMSTSTPRLTPITGC